MSPLLSVSFRLWSRDPAEVSHADVQLCESPSSVFPGDVGFSWNNEAIPADGTAGAQFAVPEPSGLADQGHVVRWTSSFTGGPTAVNLRLQGAIADVDSEYADIDTSTNTAGESRTVTGVRARFVRIKKFSSTGGTNITAKLIV